MELDSDRANSLESLEVRYWSIGWDTWRPEYATKSRVIKLQSTYPKPAH
jgi:hypothetical protein